MQNETTVGASATLSYYAGCLRFARADLARIENNSADYGAMHAQAMEAARDELACAEFDFEAEFKACQALQELAAGVAPVAVEPVKERCPHWKLIKRFFAIAREAGLDTSKEAKPKMRHALESAMGRCVDSRSEVTANEWMMLGDRVKAGLSW
jgi:hypothetical protein